MLVKQTEYISLSTGKIKENKLKPDTIFLRFTVLTASLLMVMNGGIWAWTSPAVPTLKSTDLRLNPLSTPITTIQISMLTGLPLLFGLCGTLLMPYMSDTIGRKRTMQSIGVGFFIFNTAEAFSTTITLLIIFRCINFLLIGVTSCVAVYIIEVCEDHNKVKHGCLLTLGVALGTLFTFIIGSQVNLMYLTHSISAVSFLFIILSMFIPETPVYLLSKNKIRECKMSLIKLRSNKSNDEIDIDLSTLKKDSCHEDNDEKGFFTLIKTKEVKMGLILSVGALLCQYSSGVVTILPLTDSIFGETGNNIGIYVAALQVISVWVTTFLLDKFNKKPLLVVSCIGCAISVSILGVYFYLKYINSPVVDKIGFLAVVSVLSLIFLYSIGIGSIPSTVVNEMFTPNLRATASSLVLTTVTLFLFLLNFGFPIVSKAIGSYWCFWLFGVNCLLGAVFFFCILPETDGKSVTEIQQILREFKFKFTWEK